MGEAVQAQALGVQLGDHLALSEISFTLPTGIFAAVIGPNGGGKSTLLKALLGLIPYQGQLAVLGQPPSLLDSRRIGYVPQAKNWNRSFPAQAQELVATGIYRRWPFLIPARDRPRILAALSTVGASQLAQKPLSHLSGGELQRVYLARALVRQPDLILLDEPATGIDVAGETDLYRVLETYQKQTGATILMVTHDLEVAAHHAATVLLINRKLLACGPPAEILIETNLAQAFGHSGHRHIGSFHA